MKSQLSTAVLNPDMSLDHERAVVCRRQSHHVELGPLKGRACGCVQFTPGRALVDFGVDPQAANETCL